MSYMKRLSNNKKLIVAIKQMTKQPQPIVLAKTTKPVEKKTIVSAPKKKLPTKKIKSVNSVEKSIVKNQELKPSVSAPKTKSVENKKTQMASDNSIKSPIKKVKSLVSVEAKTKSAKLPIVLVEKIKAKSVKSKTVANKVQKPKLSKTKEAKSQAVKSVSLKAKTAPFENKRTSKNAIIAAENKPEPKKLPLPPKLKKKKAKPICAAVFRGKKDRYGFEVFPLDAEFEDVSAIYVISKRKIDKRKKGHHALVCIGQTESLLGEIKRHKQGKCVKKYQANVISILPEENEKKRLRIETDLKAAHTVVCNLE